ncbi:MAG: hypothetical protein ACOC1X_04270 [Promethearchaeota archaeon]
MNLSIFSKSDERNPQTLINEKKTYNCREDGTNNPYSKPKEAQIMPLETLKNN